MSNSTGPIKKLVKIGVAPSIDTQLVRYDFSDGSGATLTDSSGNGNNGTITNATWVTNNSYFSSGNHLSFDGNGDYVTMPSNIFTNAAAFTWEFFVRFDPNVSARYVMLRSNGSATDQIYIQATTCKFVADLGSITSRPILVTNQSLTPNIWYHIVITWDSAVVTATQRLKIAINGVYDNAVASTGSGNTSNTGTWTTYLGYTTASSHLGDMCYFAGYTTAMSEATALAHVTGAKKKSGNYLCNSLWQMVEEITITTAHQAQDFQYILDGDNDGGYKIEGFLTASQGTFCIRVNGRYYDGNRTYFYQNSAASVGCNVQTPINDIFLVLAAATSTNGMSEAVLEWPETGMERFWMIKNTHADTNTNRVEAFSEIFQWTGFPTSEKIIRLGVGNINNTANSLGVGSVLRLYKQKFIYEA